MFESIDCRSWSTVVVLSIPDKAFAVRLNAGFEVLVGIAGTDCIPPEWAFPKRMTAMMTQIANAMAKAAALLFFIMRIILFLVKDF